MEQEQECGEVNENENEMAELQWEKVGERKYVGQRQSVERKAWYKQYLVQGFDGR